MDEKDEYKLRWIIRLSKGQEGRVEGEMDEKDEYRDEMDEKDECRGRWMIRMSTGGIG